MTATGDRRSRWLDFLNRHEACFNEELHLLSTGRKTVECIPPDGPETGSGWFIVWADTGAGEWNLAHPFGHRSEYFRHLERLPKDVEFNLLVPVTDAPDIAEWLHLEVAENLTWFRDVGHDAASLVAFPPSPPAGLEIIHRSERGEGMPGDAGPIVYESIYARECGSVIGLVKCIHVTGNTTEVYIETAPGWRNRGIGTILLKEMLRTLRRAGRTMIYVVGGGNTPSLRLAAKAGLTPFQTLSRFRFTRHVHKEIRPADFSPRIID